jgi:urease accessory protein
MTSTPTLPVGLRPAYAKPNRRAYSPRSSLSPNFQGINEALPRQRIGKRVACCKVSGKIRNMLRAEGNLMRSKILLLGVFVASLAAAPAYAHTGANAVFSFSSGFLHPVGGLDHLLAMFAVGLLATQLGGRSLWLIPGAFVTPMIAGAILGHMGIDAPGVEYAISFSLVAIALPVAFALSMPAGLAMILVGVFALFHGHAHGGELPMEGELLAYITGFATATALIHAAGIGFALATKGIPARVAAGAVGVVGIAFLVAGVSG